MDGGSSTVQRTSGAIGSWLDAMRHDVGARRWSVALRDGGVWNITGDEPALHDSILAQLLLDPRLHGGERASLIDVDQLGDGGARLRTAGIERLLIVPGGPNARIILDTPEPGLARQFVSEQTGPRTSVDLAAVLRTEQLASDLVALSQWWPGEGGALVTATLEGTLLAGRFSAAADGARESQAELRRSTLLRERARIASVIHEGITQVLTNVSLQLEVLRHVAEDPDKVREMVMASREAVLQSLESLRSVIFDLAPPDEEWTDVVSGLREYLIDFSSQWGVSAQFVVEGIARDVDVEIVSMSFGFVQEALANVRRHAETDAARVTLEFLPDRLAITVADAGRGPSEQEHDDLRPHQGLSIVRSRVRLLGGSFSLEWQPGEGTKVRVEVPA